MSGTGTGFRSGFCAVVGRPNVGKSTLVNAIVGSKVTITSPRPNTTRSQIRGVLTRPDAQLVLVDTPGLHKPRGVLGARMNESASASLEDVDVVVAVVEATGGIGPGDRMVLRRAWLRVGAMARAAALAAELGAQAVGRPGLLVAVNKVDAVGEERVLAQLAAAEAVLAEAEEEAEGEAAGEGQAGGDGGADRPPPVDVTFHPVSATTGRGVAALVDELVARLPEGPAYYPEGTVRDLAEVLWVADLVREELLHRVTEEVPHSIACRVTEWEWPRIRVEILVERDSQKGIVIGKGGQVLKEVGTAVRSQLPPGAYLELFVRVDKRWARSDDSLERLGY